MFSSHNRNYAQAITHPKLRWALNPRRQYQLMIIYARTLRNHRNYRRRQVFTTEYAVINDEAFEYSLLTYYIDKQQQLARLEDAGFQMLDMLDLNGAPLTPASPDSHSSAIYYMVRKTA